MENNKTYSTDSINPIVETRYSHGEALMECTEKGLTKREYFAVVAMQGFISNPNNRNWNDFHPRNAVEIADQLIEELNK